MRYLRGGVLHLSNLAWCVWRGALEPLGWEDRLLLNAVDFQCCGRPAVGVWERKKEAGCGAEGTWHLGSPDQAGCRGRFQRRFLDPPREALESSGDETVAGGGDAVSTCRLFMKQSEGQVSSQI